MKKHLSMLLAIAMVLSVLCTVVSADTASQWTYSTTAPDWAAQATFMNLAEQCEEADSAKIFCQGSPLYVFVKDQTATDKATYTATFTVPADGTYNLGLKVMNRLSDLKVSSASIAIDGVSYEVHYAPTDEADYGKVAYLTGVTADLTAGEHTFTMTSCADFDDSTIKAMFVYDFFYARAVEEKGVQIHEFNGEIDWQGLKDSGVDYVILRVWAWGEDDRFEQNYASATDVGLKVGAYILVYGDFDDDCQITGANEIGGALKVLEGKTFDYPVYVYMCPDGAAANGDDNNHFYKMTKEWNTYILSQGLNLLAANGYYPGIYCNTYFANNRLNMDDLADYSFRVQDSATDCTYAGDYDVWQYAEKEVVDKKLEVEYSYVDMVAKTKEEAPVNSLTQPETLRYVEDVEDVNAVNALIAALPDDTNVTATDIDAIKAAREAYDALGEDLQAYVDVTKLEAAETAYAQLVDNILNRLPNPADVTLTDIDVIIDAREAYDALTPEQQTLVVGYSKLVEVEEAYVALVDAMIEALPSPTDVVLEDKDAIYAALDAFNGMTDAMQKMATGAEKLNDVFVAWKNLPEGLPGDLNGDGTVDAKDALAALKHAVGKPYLTDDLVKLGDLNGDGVLDAKDALQMLKIAVGKA